MHFASRLLATLQPGPFLLALLLILVIIVGFGASYFGQLYSTALLLGQQRGRAHRPRQFPGTSLLLHLLSQRSGPISALWGKALANQSRNIFFWARLLIIWVLLPLFIPLHTALRQAGIADTTMISGYASLLAIFHILETGSGAISGEANRLVLYLTAPLRWSSFLRAKLFLFLSPALGEALAMGLILSRVLNLSIADVGIIIVTISLIVCICTMTLIWGSAWDEDLDITVEGALATWLQEEGAFTPRRLLLLNGCLLLLAGCVAILWKCPLIIAWPLLLLLNLFLLPAMFYFALAQLRHLVA